ncbi:MAG: gamma-glutamyl-gamma-aminobutyrate hydrolase family protein [Acidobacteriaceae bacterium]|nr:gamma-glutamyl-gamma-aminobutyrate hydrolase family protein [Acidobacteriaceae bacterium]
MPLNSSRVLIPYRHPKKLKPYESAVRAAGLEPVPVLTSGPVSLNSASGLLLMGGTDVNPERYGQTAQPATDEPDDERDAAELALIDEALRKDLPIFAICRGIQILNVFHGGTLIQDLPAGGPHDPDTKDVSAIAHEVNIEPGTLLDKIAGTACWRVNSRHHQAVDRVGEHLRVSAVTSDGPVIEALERPDRRFVLAVQWHPEDQIAVHPEQLKLFQSFAHAVRDS